MALQVGDTVMNLVDLGVVKRSSTGVVMRINSDNTVNIKFIRNPNCQTINRVLTFIDQSILEVNSCFDHLATKVISNIVEKSISTVNRRIHAAGLTDSKVGGKFLINPTDLKLLVKPTDSKD